MIPTNQFWFRQTSPAENPDDYEYVVELMNLTPAFGHRDGAGVVQVPGTTDMRLVCGWLPPLLNEIWETSDGITFTQLTDFPGPERHEFGLGVIGNTIWLWGGDTEPSTPSLTPTNDVWTWDSVNGWVQVTADWGAPMGDRIGAVFCIKDGYLYTIGGSGGFNTYRSSDGINWTYMGDLPATLGNGISFSNGGCTVHNGSIYISGGTGGNYLKVFKSTDGSSWTQVTSIPTGTTNYQYITGDDSSYWCKMASKWGVLFYIAGTGATGNRTGIYKSYDNGVTWKFNGSFPYRTSHARGVGISDDYVWIISGNGATDSQRIKRITKNPLASRLLYSLKLANPDYTGKCIRARRSSDNAEQDIAFDTNDEISLNSKIEDGTTSFGTWIGANSAFVKTWYDQSGNGDDITNSTAGTQPRIINAGALDVDPVDGQVAMFYSGTTIKLEHATNVDLGTNYIMSTVIVPNAASRILIGGLNNNMYGMFFNGTTMYHGNGHATQQFVFFGQATSVPSGGRTLTEVYRNRMRGWMYKDSVVKLFTAVNNSPFTGIAYYDTPFYFKKVGNDSGANSFTGHIQEVNIKTGVVEDDANTAIQTDINGRWGVY